MGKFIHLISGPRNISTALMYAFASRSDFNVVDEPFYAYYLSKCQIDYHPGTDAILNSQKRVAKEVLADLFEASKKGNVFVKNMAHHLVCFDLKWMAEVHNIFLIRDVKRLINSFAKVIPNVSLEDIGIKREWQLYHDLVQNGSRPIIVDANEILKDPKKVLSQLCDHCDLPFDEAMLSWEKGPKTYDGVWASHWYKNVHQSTGFGEAYREEVDVLPTYVPLFEEANYYYQKLYKNSIIA